MAVDQQDARLDRVIHAQPDRAPVGLRVGRLMATRRILVGVDGSDAATGALGWGARLAVATGAEVVVATAWAPAQAEVSPALRIELRAAAVAALQGDWSEPARAAGATTRTRLIDGNVHGLLAAADAEQADLVVVGPRGVGGFAPLHLGSVAHHLARHTTRPLAIVPAASGERIPRLIVVGVDGSAGSAAAVGWCAAMAPALKAEVVAVLAFNLEAAWDRQPWDSDYPDMSREALLEAARRSVEQWTAPLREAGAGGRTGRSRRLPPGHRHRRHRRAARRRSDRGRYPRAGRLSWDAPRRRGRTAGAPPPPAGRVPYHPSPPSPKMESDDSTVSAVRG